MGVKNEGIEGGREFPSTCWSLIVRAKDPASPEARRNLDRLVKLYWRPVYCVIRYAWSKNHDDAKDLTQEFFATVVFDRELLKAYAPERGSFRALLRTSLARFMQDVHRGSSRLKRGGGAPVVSLDIENIEVEGFDRADNLTPEQLFAVAWREVVMNEALSRMAAQLAEEGRGVELELFRRYDLGDEDPAPSYAVLAEAHGITVPKVKHALLHARASFRAALNEIVRDYVDDPDQLASELRFLLET